jgi:hypothetical protein
MSDLRNTNSSQAKAMAELTGALAEQCCTLEHDDGKWGRPLPYAHFDRSKAEQLIRAFLEKLENPAIARSLEILSNCDPFEPMSMQKAINEVAAVLRGAQIPL